MTTCNSLTSRLGAAFFVGATAFASAQSIDPTSCDLILNPGDVEDVLVQVCLPGGEVTQAVDVYFLSDTTGSMGSVIANVQSDASMILSQLEASITDVQFGVGEYRDFPFDAFAFRHLTTVTGDTTDVQNGINTWSASGGNDTPEANLYALHEVATEIDTIGWRDGSQRIVVWFGDAPGHEPVCSAISGEADDIDRSSVITELNDANITVIGVSTTAGGGLNASGGSGDYTGACGASSFLGGQGTDITTATGGIFELIGSAGQVTQAVLDAIEIVVMEVDISLLAKGDTADFITSISPASFDDVVIPSDPRDEVCVEFTVSFAGQDCTENVNMFLGSLNAQVDGSTVASKDVTVTQPTCETSTCLLFLGAAQTSMPLPNGEATDLLLTAPIVTWPVLLDDVPTLTIPNEASLDGIRIFLQVGMMNPFDFPADPVKSSNGIEVIIGQSWSQYGVESGMSLWLAKEPVLGGTIEPKFSIAGF